MQTKIMVELTRPARKGGADRYEGTCKDEPFTIYIPQSVSREGGAPCTKIEVLFNPI